jgi:uncharacterized protein
MFLPRSARKAIVLTALLLAVAAVPVDARVELPPHGNRSVHDLAGVIRPEHESAMERTHAELFRRTGVMIVVITVQSLDGEPIEDFALRVGETWGAGRRGEDRGIVVALAVAERQIEIATGYGVEEFLPDGRAGGILDEYVVPHLARNDFSTGLLRASAALVSVSAQEFNVTIEGAGPGRRAPDRAERSRKGPIGKIFGFLWILVLIYLFIRHPRLFLVMLLMRGGGGGGFRGGGFGGSGGGGGFGGGGFGGGGAGRGF